MIRQLQLYTAPGTTLSKYIHDALQLQVVVLAMQTFVCTLGIQDSLQLITAAKMTSNIRCPHHQTGAYKCPEWLCQRCTDPSKHICMVGKRQHRLPLV